MHLRFLKIYIYIIKVQQSHLDSLIKNISCSDLPSFSDNEPLFFFYQNKFIKQYIHAEICSNITVSLTTSFVKERERDKKRERENEQYGQKRAECKYLSVTLEFLKTVECHKNITAFVFD